MEVMHLVTVTDGKLTEKDKICTSKLELNVYSDLEKENWLHQKAAKLSWYFPPSCSKHYF